MRDFSYEIRCNARNRCQHITAAAAVHNSVPAFPIRYLFFPGCCPHRSLYLSIAPGAREKSQAKGTGEFPPPPSTLFFLSLDCFSWTHQQQQQRRQQQQNLMQLGIRQRRRTGNLIYQRLLLNSTRIAELWAPLTLCNLHSLKSRSYSRRNVL